MTSTILTAPPAAVKQAPTHRPLLSRDGLLARAREIQTTRDQNARDHAAEYELIFVEGFRYAQGVRKLSDGTGYQLDVTTEGVAECGCADYQTRIAPMNDGLRAAGVSFRCSCKHPGILHLLERVAAAQKGDE